MRLLSEALGSILIMALVAVLPLPLVAQEPDDADTAAPAGSLPGEPIPLSLV